MELTVSPWFPVHFCTNCDHILKRNERMHNGGVCPHCGNAGEGDITPNVRKAVRRIEKHPSVADRLLYRMTYCKSYEISDTITGKTYYE